MLDRFAIVATLLAISTGGFASAADRGEQIYRDQCSRCHGDRGQGTKKHPHPLTGERSPEQLADIITRTMPEDDPGSCSGPDAAAVARYIYDAFYSSAAREKVRPPRVELSRLTVPQYRNALADLIGGFRDEVKWGAARGLRGEYFASRDFAGDKRKIDRVDARVSFDFGADPPAKEGFDSNRFSIRWQGAIIAPDDGEYEFLIRCDQAFRLFVNDMKAPLIDGWVKSGSDDTFRGAIRLLGGRAVPIRLEFSKAIQGVDDEQAKKRHKNRNVPSRIALEWRRPGGVDELIPTRYLLPQRAPEVFVVTAAFPPDDRSLGWERGTSVSKAWAQGATEGAIELAAYVAARLDELAGTREGDPDRAAKVRTFCERFVERAFRQPLSDEDRKRYVGRAFDSTPDLDAAVRRVILAALKSPRFLYHDAAPAPAAYRVASTLALSLWDSLPDRELRAAAERGELTTREQIARQADRMLADPRARAKLRAFFHNWLHLEPTADLTKNPTRFPGFDPAVIHDLRESLDQMIEQIVWHGDADYRRMFDGGTLLMNGRLAKFYGADLPNDADFQPVAWQPDKRAGILTHPYILSRFSYSSDTSPIHRGVFVARGLLGQVMKPPPEAVAPIAPDLHPSLTTRERVALQTSPRACQTCHAVINPLGFALEQFDPVGRFRSEDAGKPVDASGGYLSRDGRTVRLNGARDLARFLAESPEAHEAFIERLFHHVVKQPVRAVAPDGPGTLLRSFASNRYNIRTLVKEIAVLAASSERPAGVAQSGTSP